MHKRLILPALLLVATVSMAGPDLDPAPGVALATKAQDQKTLRRLKVEMIKNDFCTTEVRLNQEEQLEREFGTDAVGRSRRFLIDAKVAKNLSNASDDDFKLRLSPKSKSLLPHLPVCTNYESLDPKLKEESLDLIQATLDPNTRKYTLRAYGMVTRTRWHQTSAFSGSEDVEGYSRLYVVNWAGDIRVPSNPKKFFKFLKRFDNGGHGKKVDDPAVKDLTGGISSK